MDCHSERSAFLLSLNSIMYDVLTEALRTRSRPKNINITMINIDLSVILYCIMFVCVLCVCVRGSHRISFHRRRTFGSLLSLLTLILARIYGSFWELVYCAPTNLLKRMWYCGMCDSPILLTYQNSTTNLVHENSHCWRATHIDMPERKRCVETQSKSAENHRKEWE